MTNPKPKTKDIDALLVKLRDSPANNDAASDSLLQQIFGYLMSVPATSAGELHWFCDQASSTTVAAASFLLRLFGFDGPSVKTWKRGFHQCLSSCAYCVQKLEEIKISSRLTYFGAYPDTILQHFFDTLEAWELQLVLEELDKAGFSVKGIPGKTLSDLPPPLLYRMLTTWKIFSDPKIQTLIHKYVPSRNVSGWPPKDPASGLLILMMDDSQPVREWARKQCLVSDLSLLPSERFSGSYVKAFEAITAAADPSRTEQNENSLPFSKDPVVFWSAFSNILRMVPVERLTASRLQSFDLRQFVIRHLSNSGSHFIDVLRSFLLLLKRLSKNLWLNEEPEYPKVVFDSIKDNPSFPSILQDIHLSGDRLWMVSWIPEFLHTIQDYGVYGDILAKTVDFLCEELQHERFKDARPVIMNSGIQLLTSVFRKYETDKAFRHGAALLSVLDAHSGTLVSVAYARDYFGKDSWTTARSSARALVGIILLRDIQQILATISRVCQSLAQVKSKAQVDSIPVLTIRAKMWKSIYGTIHTKDLAGIASVINIAGKSCYLSTMLKEPFEGLERVKNASDGSLFGSKALDQVNEALSHIQTGFLDVISKFADYSVSTSALDVLRQPEVGKSVVMLLLSPVFDFQVAAQTLIGLAFDVDVRADCFRAMFINMPEATFDGIVEFLSRFNIYAPQVPEACNLSKSLVRCFNDIFEVFCSSPDGLLLKADFVRSRDPNGPASRLLELWKLLTTSLTIIFKRTVSWAAYYKPKEMVEWMRDAIILGRDVIKQWRLIENAAIGNAAAKPSKSLSEIGDKMVSCFQGMLPELARWLRLTDEELLYQAFAILRSLLEVFKETNKRPHEATLAKLSKYVTDARADSTGSRSRLDAASLMKLEDALGAFDISSSDDEIEIIGHKKPPPVVPKKYIMGQQVLSKKQPTQAYTKTAHVKHLESRPSLPGSKISTESGKVEESLPTIRRPAPIPSSSKVVIPSKRVPVKRAEPKNEALSKAVDSEESSGSSDSEEEMAPEVGLSALGQLPKSPKIKKREERRQIKTLEIAMSKNAMQERFIKRARNNAQNVAQRLRPDISRLHKVILSWNYEHTGPIPPGDKIQMAYVPPEFNDYNHYRQIFEPLLLLECWSQILRTKDETPDSYLCKVASKQYVSDWLDVGLSITDIVSKDWELAAETDIVLISTPDRQKSILAKVLSSKKHPMGMAVEARCFMQGGNADPGLLVGTAWRISKVFSLSTINREYGALMSLPYLNFFDFIMNPRLSKLPYIDSKEIERTMATYNVNKPQATAILGAMAADGFVLIQGPPGTGKTSTICALVSRFMAQRPQPIHVPGKATDNTPKAKVLICAPSNAAIDEIAYRLKDKHSGSEKSGKKLNVVRTGGYSQISTAVKSISLDNLVSDKIKEKTGLQGASTEETNKEIAKLSHEMDYLKNQREDKLKELTNILDDVVRRTALERETQSLRMRRQELASKLNALKDKVRSDNRSLDTLRRQMRKEVLQEADVVCSTLSGAGHDVLVEQDFEMVIIDEAAQAIELSSLIPLKYNCTRCVMVGDPQQLPPTVLSQEATRHKYDQSLFLRLFNRCPESVHLLSIQYRMHPEISRFPSQAFYQRRIQDGPRMAELTTRPWHSQSRFGIYKFFNVAGVESQGAFGSVKNIAEVQVARQLYSRLNKDYGLTGRIGVVSMYRAQVKELRQQFLQAFGQDILDKIDFNTVDGFQGQEKDIIILSCVRAGPGLQSIGFLSDVRRMNVAITRAKSSLFILGNAATLERSDETWRRLISDARERSLFVNADINLFSQPSSISTSATAEPIVEPPKKKPRISAPSQSLQPLPVDLVTPKAFKAAAEKSAASIPAESAQPNSDAVSIPQAPTATVLVPVAKISAPSQASQRLPAAASIPVEPAQSMSNGVSLPQAQAAAVVAGVKRPAEEPAPSKAQGAPAPPRPRNERPPPNKRPKTTTMFIPKKPKK